MTKVFLFAALVSSFAPTNNNNFKQNIVGDWHSFISGSWKVNKEENKTIFFKNETNELGENVGFSFIGKTKDGSYIDTFSFVGSTEDEFYQTEDNDFCMLSRTLKTKGRVDENKIHMSGCVITVSTFCFSGKYSRKIFSCSGVWR